MAKYEYVGGIADHERHTIERFENDILPYTITHGPRIGEMAMQGDDDAIAVIRYQRAFCEGDPAWREMNLKRLAAALKRVDMKIH